MITLWGRRNSSNVQKVLWALHELDLPFRRERVGGSFGGNHDADFLAMNPMGLVPVIRDGDVTMCESNAILRYGASRLDVVGSINTNPSLWQFDETRRVVFADDLDNGDLAFPTFR